MPIGTGADVLETVPGREFVSDPATFNALTRPNVTPFGQVADPGAGGVVRVNVPQVGVLGMLRATFRGSITISAPTTTLDRWPHGLVSDVQLSLNGQDKLFSCDGCDLHVLRFARNPAYAESVDLFPSTLGGGAIAAGTYELDLSWEIPVAMDMTSLVGALYMQSSATNLNLALGRASVAQLFATPANVTAFSGTWFFESHTFAVPRDSKSQLVVPDLSRMHNFTGLDLPVTNAGEVRFPLIRQSGQLTRLFISARKDTTTPLSFRPSAAANSRVEALRLEYGGNERPFVWDPVSALLRLNNVFYGGLLPYNRIAIDLVRTNPARDALVLLGVTELATVLTQNSAVTPGAGAAMRLVQETLYS